MLASPAKIFNAAVNKSILEMSRALIMGSPPFRRFDSVAALNTQAVRAEQQRDMALAFGPGIPNESGP